VSLFPISFFKATAGFCNYFLTSVNPEMDWSSAFIYTLASSRFAAFSVSCSTLATTSVKASPALSVMSLSFVYSFTHLMYSLEPWLKWVAMMSGARSVSCSLGLLFKIALINAGTLVSAVTILILMEASDSLCDLNFIKILFELLS